jgi:class 3 adenylate cyclase/tetratricopeptide (TPR) repeat protein
MSIGTAERRVKSEIAHVLFLDIVGFTRLRPAKQHLVLEALQTIVRSADEFCNGNNSDELIALPTGDGMALVFFTKEDGSGPAISCAEQITRAINGYNQSAQPDLQLSVRMGLHSGNVIRIDDINMRPNVAGDGINTAQRVMDCGDIGHILLSDKAFHLLPPEPDRTDMCQPLGEVKVKHDQVVHLYNLCDGAIGNAQVPKRVFAQQEAKEASEKQDKLIKEAITDIEQSQRKHRQLRIGLAIVVALTLIAGVFVARRLLRRPPTLAVLPFKSPSNKVNSKAINQGLTEQMLHIFADMTNLGSANLKPQGQVESAIKMLEGKNHQPFTLRALAQQLGVRYILKGDAKPISVRDDLDTTTDMNADFLVEVHVEFYDAEQDNFRSTDYHTSFKNLSALPLEIANQVLPEMELPVITAEFFTDQYNKNARAFWYCLKGRYSWTNRVDNEGNQLGVGVVNDYAIKSFKSAIEANSQYAPAYAGLADLYTTIGGISMPPNEAKEHILRYAERAVVTGKEQLAQPYASIGREKCWFERDFLMARTAFLHAIKIDPRYMNSFLWYSSCLTWFGQFEEAKIQMESARSLEPDSLIVQTVIGQNYYFSNQNDAAIKQLEEIDNKKPFVYRFLAMAYEQAGQYDKALEALGKARGENQAEDDSNVDSDLLGEEGHIYAHKGDYDKARGIADKLVRLRGGDAPVEKPRPGRYIFLPTTLPSSTARYRVMRLKPLNGSTTQSKTLKALTCASPGSKLIPDLRGCAGRKRMSLTNACGRPGSRLTRPAYLWFRSPVYSISLLLIWRIANSHLAPFASMISRSRFATGPILSASVSGSPVA